MTSRIAILAAILLVAGCEDGSGFNPSKVRAAVAQDYPDAEVTNAPGLKFTFLVRRQDGSVLWVEYMGVDTKATVEAVMFRASR